MNNSEKNDDFLARCQVGETSTFALSKFPTKKHEKYQIAITLVYILLFLSTISLNGISVITIRRSSQLKSKIAYFVIFLQSIVDLSVGALTIPLCIYFSLLPFLQTTDCASALVVTRISPVPPCLSMVTLSALTMERYIGVLHPYQYQIWVTKKRILSYVCGCGVLICFVVAYSFYDQQIIYFVFSMMFGFLLLTGYVYTRIYFVIRKLIRSEKRPNCQSAINYDKKRMIEREGRSVRSCFSVVICFTLFLTPITLSDAIFTVGTYQHIVYFDCSLAFVILNSSVNSLIFFWTKTLLRKAAVKMLKSIVS